MVSNKIFTLDGNTLDPANTARHTGVSPAEPTDMYDYTQYNLKKRLVLWNKTK